MEIFKASDSGNNRRFAEQLNTWRANRSFDLKDLEPMTPTFEGLFPYLKRRKLPKLPLPRSVCVVTYQYSYEWNIDLRRYVENHVNWVMLKIALGLRKRKNEYNRGYNCYTVGYFNKYGEAIPVDTEHSFGFDINSRYFVTYINNKDKKRVCNICPFRFHCITGGADMP